MTAPGETWQALILAGGSGSRLHPMTRGSNKHLLPVYDKPMIYYALSTVMFAGIRDIVLLSTPTAVPQFERLLGDGGQWGLTIRYLVQERPNGIGEGLKLAAPLLAGKNVAVMLGDNVFFGSGLSQLLSRAIAQNEGASVFAYEVANPEAFGIVTLDTAGKPVAIVEKPKAPDSSLAVTGLYFYAPDVVDVVETLSPSHRGELEITDVNRAYLEQGRLKVYTLGRGYAWLDGGTPHNLFEASEFIRVVEARTGLKIGCPEEVAYRMCFISLDQLAAIAKKAPACEYADYLFALVRQAQKQPE
jgi:glucose-1-phosphate thymidylyltransferase